MKRFPFEAKVDIDGGNPIFTWTTKSNLWTKKVYTLTCREDNFSYKVKVEGKGSLFVLDYFKGLEKDPENYSSYEFCEGFIPMAHETHLDHAYDTSFVLLFFQDRGTFGAFGLGAGL